VVIAKLCNYYDLIKTFGLKRLKPIFSHRTPNKDISNSLFSYSEAEEGE
jgi:hypothetical protein